MTPRLLLLLAAAASLRAQPDPIAALLDRARAEPVEIFADVAFRLLEAGKIPPGGKTALLEEIFERAPQAREPHPWSLALPAVPRGAAEARTQIQPLRLDALSLRTRAVQLLLPTNPRRAVELFDQIPAIPLPAAVCEDPYVASLTPLYETLLPVVTRGRFTPDEREKQRPLEMVLRRLRELSSPAELGPATRLVRDLLLRHDWPPEDLAATYSAAVANLHSSDRAFSFSIDHRDGDALRDALTLAVALRDRGANIVALLSAWRLFLVRHLQSPRCADSYARLSGQSANEEWREAFLAERNFNRTLTRWQITDVAPLTAGDVRPGKLTAAVSDTPWPNESDLGSLHAAIGQLRQPGDDWDQRASGLLRRIEDFRGPPKLSAQQLWLQRVQLWSALIDHTPPGPIFDRAVRGWVAEMSDARARSDQPALWLVQLGSTLRMARAFSKEEAAELEDARKRVPTLRIPRLPHPAGSSLLDALRQAPDPALALYADLEALAPQSHGSWRN